MTKPKNIIICADDFGLNSEVSQGILKLAGMNRLSAVSCMVNMSDFSHHAKNLLNLNNKIKTGLHFNFTEGFLLSEPNKHCFNLNELIIKSHLGLIKTSFIVNEMNAQLDQYIHVMGGLPDFVDGHQHVHQFPKIRQALLEVYEQRLKRNGTFIRSTYPAVTLPQYHLKSTILAWTGGKTFNSQLNKLNIPHNNYFSGIYDFDPGSNYRALFRLWLKLAPTNTLIMCHPGEGGNQSDVIAPTRKLEMNYFLSDDFLNDCQEYQVNLDFLRHAQCLDRKKV